MPFDDDDVPPDSAAATTSLSSVSASSTILAKSLSLSIDIRLLLSVALTYIC